MRIGAHDGLWRQLALPFPHATQYDVEGFCRAPSNAAALTWVRRTSDWPDGKLAIWGEEGRGKTHLLHCWVHETRAELIDGPALRGLVSLPQGGVAVDDADSVLDEESLMHLLNAAREIGRPVLLAGRTPPARWPIRLPDLSSRLRAVTAVELGRPEDELLRTLFSRLLWERQLVVAQAVQDWLLLRLPRNAAALHEAACRLDHASLAFGGRITRVVSAAILREMQGWEDDSRGENDVLESSQSSMWPPARSMI